MKHSAAMELVTNVYFFVIFHTFPSQIAGNTYIHLT